VSETIFGLHAVQAALSRHPDQVSELWVDGQRQDKRMRQIIQLAQGASVSLHMCRREEIDELAPEAKHQGVVARVQQPKAFEEADLMALLDGLDVPPFLLILDGVTDPHNLGACLRSADAAGVQAVIAPKDRAAPLTATAMKVASGAAEMVPYVQVVNLARTLRALQDRGIWLVGLDGYADQGLFELDLRGPLAIVMGAEGQGLRRLTKEHCDFLAKIPMAGTVESLNVSVATGICLFEALRQRNGG
jgi:23S rRNA (guanosine2251-2'-O)-methyltransferase